MFIQYRAFFALAIALGFIAAAGAFAAERMEVGQTAPAFSVRDQDGTSHSLADCKGKVVVLEWTNPDCPFVQRHYREGTFKSLSEKYSGRGVVWFAVNSNFNTTTAKTVEWRKKQSIAYPTLMDTTGTLGMEYGARTSPHVFVIDRQGRLAYSGAVDDDPAGEKPVAGRTPYLENAIKAALADKTPERSETRSYGCAIKYVSR